MTPFVAITSLVGMVFTFSSIFFLITTAIQKKLREDISGRISYGEVCYRCKLDTGKNLMDLFKHGNSLDPSLCPACERENKLNDVLGKKLLNIKEIPPNKLRIIGMVFNGCAMVFNILSLWYKPLGLLGGICLCSGCYMFHRNMLRTSRPKIKIKR